MGNCLYLECLTGISGDMTAAALLDLGADREALERALASLPVDGFAVRISRVKKSGLDVCDFDVLLDAEHENHDHDMEYLYGGTGDAHASESAHGHDHEHSHEHSHDHEHAGDHTHPHDHAHEHDHSHPHVHRGMREIRQILEQAEMTERARKTAERIFDILADAEAAAHGVGKEEVHFHEVGAVDSIVDIVAVSVCLDSLDITEAVVPKLCEGSGFVRCQHGLIPVPVPAVANIAGAHGLKLSVTDVQGELVTPTGAAIVAAIRTRDQLPDGFVIRKIGMGAGKRAYERPSILRAMLIEDAKREEDEICKLETNIDDCSGEALGYVMERLFEAGARDVHYMPVYMKKNRPAWQLNVICMPQDRQKLEEILFRETTTIGIRRVMMQRTVLERRNVTISTTLGEAEVKVCRLEATSRCYPEYDSAARLARENDLPFLEAYERIRAEGERKLAEEG